MSDNSYNLNSNQAEAVAHGDGPALVLAGAGSGKTRVITGRAVRLISSGVAPWSIFCVTFTNKAAGEMRQRIGASLGLDVNDLWISTFHSSCLRIIKSEYQRLGFPSVPVVFDTTDQRSLVKGIVKDMGMTDADMPHRQVMGVISRFKNEMKGPEEMAAEKSIRNAATIAEIYHKYQSALKSNNAVDFDDLLVLAIRLFRGHKDVLERYRQRFRYVMVDEFQDTNHVQYLLLRLLSAGHGNIFVVGDDDQSIYRWRGARVGNLLDFEKDYPGCKVIKLEENYRSTGNILKAAGAMVKSIHGRKDKTLWTRQSDGEDVTIYSASDEMDEAMFMVQEVRSAVVAGTATYGDFAVFYRTNAQSRVIEECFNSMRLPYRIYGGLKFYDRKEIKDIMAYLRLAMNERDDVSFMRAVASPPRGIGQTTLLKLREWAGSRGQSMLMACADVSNGLPAAAAKKLAAFHSMIMKIREESVNSPASRVIEVALEESGYITALLMKRTAQDNARAENLQELVSAPGPQESLMEFLDRVSLVSDSDMVDETSDNVSLMTLHVSKGLEFPFVFMTGMEENLFPHANSMNSMEEIDEERRLCYVGMTRAMRKLYMTRAMRRRIFGSVEINNPSIFLDDLPEGTFEKKSARVSTFQPSGSFQPATRSANHVPEAEGGGDMCKDGFPVGMAVVHKIFGRGVVTHREGVGDEMKLTIKFRGAGMKKLKKSFVQPAA